MMAFARKRCSRWPQAISRWPREMPRLPVGSSCSTSPIFSACISLIFIDILRHFLLPRDCMLWRSNDSVFLHHQTSLSCVFIAFFCAFILSLTFVVSVVPPFWLAVSLVKPPWSRPGPFLKWEWSKSLSFPASLFFPERKSRCTNSRSQGMYVVGTSRILFSWHASRISPQSGEHTVNLCKSKKFSIFHC